MKSKKEIFLEENIVESMACHSIDSLI